MAGCVEPLFLDNDVTVAKRVNWAHRNCFEFEQKRICVIEPVAVECVWIFPKYILVI